MMLQMTLNAACFAHVGVATQSGRLLRSVAKPWRVRAHTTASSSAASASPVQQVYSLAAQGDLVGARSAMDLLTANDGELPGRAVARVPTG